MDIENIATILKLNMGGALLRANAYLYVGMVKRVRTTNESSGS